MKKRVERMKKDGERREVVVVEREREREREDGGTATPLLAIGSWQ